MDELISSKPKRNATATKARILDAAKQCFSEQGYAKTGIRDVAAVAGVSYTLLGRYFGSKAGLLEAALMETLDAEPITSVERTSFGENLAGLLAGRDTRVEATSLMTVLAAGDPIGRLVATRAVETKLIQPLAKWLGPPAGYERAVAITMLGSGFVTHSRLLSLLGGPEKLRPEHPTVRWLADSLQAIVDEPDSWHRYMPRLGLTSEAEH